MKQDEIDWLLDRDPNLHPKRRDYLTAKWARRNKAHYKDLILHKSTHMYRIDGHVVIATFRNFPRSVGILWDGGDNGWYLFTRRRDNWVGEPYYDDDWLVCVEQHPNPRKIWERMNLREWRRHKCEDRFHKKIRPTHWYHREPNECRPECQCRSIYGN